MWHAREHRHILLDLAVILQVLSMDHARRAQLLDTREGAVPRDVQDVCCFAFVKVMSCFEHLPL